MRTALIFLLFSSAVEAQNSSLSGRVTDESGAIVRSAVVSVSQAAGPVQTTTSRADGTYSFPRLAPGAYTINASAPKLVLAQPAQLEIKAGANRLDIRLTVQATEQKLTVESNAGPAVSTDAASNASATIITGEDLQALSDDPEDLAADLAALAGPAAGPSGGSIFIDGFSGGQLPPKESIREIRINQNPFSPEYDKLGYGRIEIFTKPGSDKFHGSIGYNLGTQWWNGRNPYASQKAPFLLQETENSIAGPLSHRASFTLDFERQAVDNGSISNGVALDPQSLQPTAFNTVITTPQRHTLVGPHVDYRLNDNNTLSLRYLYTLATIDDAGIGGFDQISRGYHVQNTFDTVQVVETSIHGSSINETRFQFFRQGNETVANTAAPEIQVLGSFNGGGASNPHGHDVQNSYEFQNYTSVLRGAHSWRFGVRLRGQTDDSYAPINFNGTFTFSGTLAPELNAANQPIPGTSIQISSIEQYRRTVYFQSLGLPMSTIQALGGGASQFTMSAGNPETSAGQMDAGLFVGDDWRVRNNLTLSLGLRYEVQTNIGDRGDWAPRVAVAWAPGAIKGKTAKTVIRAGFGMFYDRFSLANTLAAERYNGSVQQQYVVTSPGFFPDIPASLPGGAKPSQAIQQKDSTLQAPYIMQSAVTLERQLPKNTTFAATYTDSHAVHVLRSNNINAPVPVTGTYPYGPGGPIFLMTSAAVYNQNQLILNVNSKLAPAVSFFGYYVLNHANSNSDGLGTFPANPYNFAGEYGPAATDLRQRVLVGGSINTRWNVRLSPMITLQSGAPFNITSGEDYYDTTIFNARPGVTTDPHRTGVIQTPYGLLDPYPVPGEPVLGRNAGRGPGIYSVNVRVSKTWGFGPEKASGTARDQRPAATGPTLTAPTGRGLFSTPTTTRRYNLIVGMSVRNLLNHTNPGPVIGNITSPLFGQSNQMYGTPNGEGFSENASNRRLELQIRFTF